MFFRPCKGCLVQERPGVPCLAHTNTASQIHTHIYSRHTRHSGYCPLNISTETLWTCSPLKIDVLDFSVALQQSLPQAQSPSAYLCHFNGGELSLLRKKSVIKLQFYLNELQFYSYEIPFIPPLFLLCEWLNQALSYL